MEQMSMGHRESDIEDTERKANLFTKAGCICLLVGMVLFAISLIPLLFIEYDAGIYPYIGWSLLGSGIVISSIGRHEVRTLKILRALQQK